VSSVSVLALFAVGILAGVLTGVPAGAQSSWKTTSGQWGAGENWSSGTSPNALDEHAVFDSNLTPAGNRTINLATLTTSATVGQLTIGGMGGTTATTFNSGTLTFASTDPTGAVFTVQDANNVSFNSAINLAGKLSLVINSGAANGFANNFTIGVPNGAGGTILGNGHALDVVAGNPSATITLNGVVSGTGTRLTKSGAGRLVLANAGNSFDGGLAVNVGSVTAAISGTGNGIVLGAAQAGANHLGAGNVAVANHGSFIDARSGAAGQFVELRSGTLVLLADLVGAPEFRLTEVSSAHNGFAFRMTGGELSGLGGTGTGAGTLHLTAADFDYSAGLITGAPNLTLDTTTSSNAANNITITLNGTTMDGRLGTMRKLGLNNLAFAGSGTFRATDFVIANAIGTVSLDTATLDLANGLTYSGTNAVAWTSRLSAPSAQTVFGADNQLIGGVNLNAGVISNLMLKGHNQTFDQITLGNNARPGLWFDTTTSSTLTVNTLTTTAAISSSSTTAASVSPAATVNPLGQNYLSLYNWTGNPASHSADGTIAANGNTVKAGAGVDLSKIWFRGYAPGAQRDSAGNLAPVDFLRTTISGTNLIDTGWGMGLRWYDFASWSVDVANGAGSTVVANAAAASPDNITLGNRYGGILGSATVGHIVVDSVLNILSGTVIFDSGVAGAASTISGSRSLAIGNGDGGAMVLNNDLLITNAGRDLLDHMAGVRLNGALSGSGGLIIGAPASMYVNGSINDYTGNIDVSGILMFYTPVGATPRQYSHSGTIFAHNGAQLNNDNYGWNGSHASVALDSALVIDGNFTLKGVMINHAGDVALTVSPTITISGGGDTGQLAGFSGSTHLTGTGGLTIAGDYAALLSGSNTFGGGLVKTGWGTLHTYLHGDLVAGELSAGNNYLGSSDIAINDATAAIAVHNDGHNAELRGVTSSTTGGAFRFIGGGTTTVSGTMNLGNNASVTFDGGNGLIAAGATWDTTAGNSRIYFNRDLTVNAPFLGNAVNFYANQAPGTTHALSSTMAGGITNVITLVKENEGTLVLSSTLHFSGLNLWGGMVVLGGNELVRPQTGTVPATSVVMNAGNLYAKGGSAGAPWVNRFNNLNITGNSGMFLENHSALYFNAVTGWSTVAGGTNYHTLNFANDSGLWSTAADPAAYDTYVYFSNTAGFGGTNAPRLDHVAFTGYAQGAELVRAGAANLWFLAPTGAKVLEWVGARSSGADTDRLWSSSTNWVGGVPNAAGAGVVVRDVDGLLNRNVIVVDTRATIGSLSLESSNAQNFVLTATNGATLTFNNSGSHATLRNDGDHTATINASLHLADDLDLFNNSAKWLHLDGAIGGPGGIWHDTAGVVAPGGSGSASTYTGGFHMIGSTAATASAAANAGAGQRLVIINGDGALFGSGSRNAAGAAGGIQSLSIGDGTPGKWYALRSNTPGEDRVVDGSLRLAGNLFLSTTTPAHNKGIVFRSADPGYIASGTWTIQGTTGWYEHNMSPLTLDMDLQGGSDSALHINGARVDLLGNNSFGGGVTLNNYRSILGVGSDTALGTGTVQITGVHGGQFLALGGTRTLDNTFSFDSTGGVTFGGGNFILSHNGTSTLRKNTDFNVAASNTVTVNASHVLTGTGEFHAGSRGSGGGTLVLLGSNAYTGNTVMNLWATLAAGNDNALGSGTLVFAYSDGNVSTLASRGGDRTIRNDLAFVPGYNNNTYANLAGVDGVLTLDPARMTQSGGVMMNVTGTVVLGQNVIFGGTNFFTKNGAGLLVVNTGRSDYTGTTTVTGGTLRAVAAGDITLGAADAGNNHLGTGALVTGNSAVLELLSATGTAVRFAGDIALNDASRINVTGSAGAVTGGITTFFTATGAQTLSGASWAGLHTPGDIVKTGPGTLNWTGANITTGTGASFIMENGVINWNSGALNTGTLALSGGALNANASFSAPGLRHVALGSGTLAVASNFNFTADNALLSLSGTAAIDFVSGTGLITFKGIDGANWSGGLDILNWAGNSAMGNGAAQLRFTDNVISVLDAARLARLQFHSTITGISYAQGAHIARNAAGYYELLPLGLTAEWRGGGVTPDWSVPANWIGEMPPVGPGNYATFGDKDAALNGKIVRIDTGLTLGGFVFAGTTGAEFSIDGAQLALNGGAGSPAVFNMSGNSSVDIEVAAMLLETDLEVRQHGSGTLTVSGVLTGGTGALVKTGTGVLALTAQNTYAGGTELRDGVIEFGASTTGAVDSVAHGPLGTGTLAVTGDGALRLTATGAQTLNNRVTTGTGATLTLNTVAGNRATLGAPVTGAGGLAKTGSGTLTLTGTQRYTGATDLFEGMLLVTTANALAGSATVTVDATLETNGHDQTLRNLGGAATGTILLSNGNTLTASSSAGAATTYAGLVTGDGAFTLNGGGALTLSASQRYTGSTTVTGGTLTLDAANALASGAAVKVDGVLASGTSQTLDRLSGTGEVDLLAGMLTLRNEAASEFSGRITGNSDLTKTGTGVLTLAGDNTHTGSTRVTGGELVLGNGGATGSILAMSDTTKPVTIDAGASLVFNRNDTVTLTGANLTGGGTVAQRGSGLLAFDGAGAQGQWTGGSVVESGTMKVMHAAGVGSGTITIRDGAAFVFGETSADGGSAKDYELAHAIAGGGVLAFDISEESAAVGAPAAITFGATASDAAARGRDFHGTVEMRHATYRVDPDSLAFLNSGTSRLRTADGSHGSIAGAAGATHRIAGGVDFAGGAFEWAFDNLNNPRSSLSSGSIGISAPTQFRLNLQREVNANTSGTQTLVSLFNTVVAGADSLLLAHSDTPVTGATNWADLHYTTDNGANWRPLDDPLRQTIVQNNTENAKSVFNWAVVPVSGSFASELRVGYALRGLEVFKDATLEVALTATDARNTFTTAISDYVFTATDGAACAAREGSGSVLFTDATGTMGILLNSANSYTGTTAIDKGTTLTLGNDAALGGAARHTTLVSATAAGTVLDVNGKHTSVGGVNITGGAQIALNGGTLDILGNTPGAGTATAPGGGTINGDDALTGAGALNVGLGLLTINGANANLHGTGSIAPAAGAVLDNVSGLGDGALTVTGSLKFDGATGTNANALVGAGLVAATNAANIVLGGSNTAFTGTWTIDAASRLKATSAASLGTGAVAVAGTLTLGAPPLGAPPLGAPTFQSADWTLAPATHITGPGTLLKEDTNTITITHANTRTGTTLITAGTLVAQNAAALGTGTISVAPAGSVRFDSFTGTVANAITGAGLAAIGGDNTATAVTIAGDNTAFTGHWHIATGAAATMTSQQNLGATGTTKVSIAPGGNLTLADMGGDYAFNQPLTGAGRLLLANTGALDFGAATGTAFTGTVTLQNNTLALDVANAAPLANATLEISGNNKTTVAPGTHRTGNLALTGGTIAFALDATGTAASGIVSTGTLALATATPTVVMIDTGSFNQTLPLLQQDERRDLLLVAATAHTGATQISGSNLVDRDGRELSAATHRDIIQNSATTARTAYDFAATANNSGLRLGYELVALDLIAGQTTVLDHETAFITDGDELHALVTGPGNLQISASTAIFLNNGNNTYTGETIVTGGTLVTGNTGALGQTSLLTIAPAAAVNLNVTAQTVGALTNAGALHLGGGTLALTGATGASTSTGALTGTGALLVQSDTLTIANANPALAANTTIAAGATADLKHASALGDTGTITANGHLVLDVPSSALQPFSPSTLQHFSPSLSGTGAFIKTNTGTVAIVTPNPGFTGAARVEAGRLLLENLDALGTAAIDVSTAAVLEYRNVTGTLASAISGPGTLALTDTGPLTIARDNAIENTVLENAKVRLAATRALGSDTATVHAGSRSEILLDINGARLGHVTLDGAKLGFTQSANGALPPLFKTGTVATLSAGAAGATLAFNVDLTNNSGLTSPGATADHLTVTGTSAGAFTVTVNTLGGAPGANETAIPLITDPAGAAIYRLEGGKLTLGFSEFEFANGTAANSTLPLEARTWYLYSTGLSQAADAIIDTAALAGRDWLYSLDALHLRMGDVRALGSTSTSTLNLNPGGSATSAGSVWVRTRGYRLNANNVLTGRGVRQYACGATAGGDKAFGTETGVNLLGGFIDMGRVTRDFGPGGDGHTDAISAGLYGTLLKNNGWHADLVLKADRLRHHFEINTANGRSVRARYNSEIYGASLEVGRRLGRAGGWWLEPVAQAAVARLTGADYRTTPAGMAVAVNVDASTLAQYRGLVRFGRHLNNARWTPHGSFGVARTQSTGGGIRAHDRYFAPAALKLDGWRLEAGAGISYRLGDNSQLYFDYEYSRAAHYERPWSLNLGYRHLW
jgi:autotransporter-associated beta strand protein